MSKRLMTPADIFGLTHVGDAQISPDGKQVAYVRERLNEEKDKSETAIYLVAVEGGAERQLTAGPGDQMPRWSPDGKSIAFVSSRSGKAQIHLIPADGGEAQALETKEEPASAPTWSPDGKQIAFLSMVEEPVPEGGVAYAGAPKAKAQPAGKKEDDKKASGIKVVTTVHHKQDGLGFFGRKEPRIFTVAAAAGKQEAKQVSPVGLRCDAPAWSPDSRYLAASVSPDIDSPRGLWLRNLYLFDQQSGEAIQVLKEGNFPAFAPAFSPDGKHLAFSGEADRFGWLHDNFDVFVLDISQGAFPYSWSEARNLSAPLDRSVGGVYSETSHMGGMVMFGPVAFSPDSRQVLAVFADQGDATLFGFDLNGENPRKLSGEGPRAVGSFSVAHDGTLAFSASSPERPDEVFVAGRGGIRQLTDCNAAFLADVAVQKVEKFSYAGAQGWPMEGWIVYPAGYQAGKAYPTVLDIHGGPAGLWGNGFYTTHQMLAAAGYVVVTTNPRGSQGYGKKHAWGCVNDWGGQDYLDIQAGLDEVIRRGIADPDRLGVTGWSYGGYMTCWTVTQTNRFKAAIPGACVSNLDDMFTSSDIGANFLEFQFGATPWENLAKLGAHSPIRQMHKCQTPMLLLHGEADLRCPAHQSEQVFTVLKQLGRTAAMVRYPDEPHVLHRPSHRVDKLERMTAWFDHYLV